MYYSIRGQRAKGQTGKEPTAGPEEARPTQGAAASKGRRRESKVPREVPTTALKWPTNYKDPKCTHMPNREDI